MPPLPLFSFLFSFIFVVAELHVVDGMPSFLFTHSKYSVAASEAERIGVDQARGLGGEGGGVRCSAFLSSERRQPLPRLVGPPFLQASSCCRFGSYPSTSGARRLSLQPRKE